MSIYIFFIYINYKLNIKISMFFFFGPSFFVARLWFVLFKYNKVPITIITNLIIPVVSWKIVYWYTFCVNKILSLSPSSFSFSSLLQARQGKWKIYICVCAWKEKTMPHEIKYSHDYSKSRSIVVRVRILGKISNFTLYVYSYDILISYDLSMIS